MGIQFDGDQGNFYDTEVSTSLSALWSIGFLVSIRPATGGIAVFDYALSTGNLNDPGTINIYFDHRSEYRLWYADVDGNPDLSTDIIDPDTWYLICLQREADGNVRMYAGKRGDDIVETDVLTAATATNYPIPTLYLGARADLNTGRHLTGDLAEVWLADGTTLNVAQMTSISKGRSTPRVEIGDANVICYLPSLSAGRILTSEVNTALAFYRNGTVTSVDHPVDYDASNRPLFGVPKFNFQVPVYSVGTAPLFEATRLLMPFNETHLSTDFKDYASKLWAGDHDFENPGRTISFEGPAYHDNRESSHYSTSLFIDGLSSSVKINFNDTFISRLPLTFGSQDFIIELWTMVSAFTQPASTWVAWFETASPLVSQFSFAFRYTSAEIAFDYSTDDSGQSPIRTFSVPYALPINTWVHVAVSRRNDQLRMFVDGQPIGDAHTVGGSGFIFSGDPFGVIPPTSLTVGAAGNPTLANSYHHGWVQDLAIRIGNWAYGGVFGFPCFYRWAFTPWSPWTGKVTGVVTAETGSPAARAVRAYSKADSWLRADIVSQGLTGAFETPWVPRTPTALIVRRDTEECDLAYTTMPRVP